MSNWTTTDIPTRPAAPPSSPAPTPASAMRPPHWAYGQSKLANLLFTYELQRRLIGTETIAVAAHPGSSSSELSRNVAALVRFAFAPLTLQGADMGALPTLRAATDPSVLGGQYYGPDGFLEMRGYPKVVVSNDRSHDVDTQRRLWAVSAELTSVESLVS